jgi:phosphotransferase system enzyme I (PtsP)
MAGGVHARQRLASVVRLIASSMVADVCSIYARLSDDTLLLIATEGLLPDAVYRTRLSVNEGLVGLVARRAEPMAIQDAPRHPAFSYRPETGEDPFHAFLGVPILRGGKVTGVLTLQNRTERLYGEDEIEALQTIAMVLAELVSQIAPELPGGKSGSARQKAGRISILKGRVFCEGIGFGRVLLHDPAVPETKFFAGDTEAELERLQAALSELRASIDHMTAIDGAALGDDPREVMEAFRMLAHDPGWANRLAEGVQSGLTAEAAVDRVRRDHRARMQQARDPYLRERLDDLENLDNRLLRVLAGGAMKTARAGEPQVLVARRLGPAELLEYSATGLAGILMEEAAASSHAAIVARALGVPAIGSIPDLTLQLEEGDPVIVDAERGEVHIGGGAALTSAYRARSAMRTERQAAYAALKSLPGQTRDGIEIGLMINAGLDLDLDMLDQSGADGVGLFRTEFQFLVSDQLPRLGDQVALYKRVLDRAGERPVIFRTLDLGGDKVLPAFSDIKEENPALGWRSIRFALDYKGVFRRQLRALIIAAGERPLSVMFPMVTVPSEFEAARALLEKEVELQRKRTGLSPARLDIGVMLETPALAFCLPELAGKANFLSIGTNDLAQFFFAADRMTPKVADRYDLISPAFLRFLRQACAEAAKAGMRVSACGEATAAPLTAACFAAVGVGTLSMQASAIGAAKHMIRSLDLGAFSSDLYKALEKPNASFRNEVLGFAKQHSIDFQDG